MLNVEKHQSFNTIHSMMTEPKKGFTPKGGSTPQFPSKAQQGKNLAKFTMQVVKDVVVGGIGSDDIFVSSTIQNDRMNVCRGCEYYSKSNNRCRQCGCWLIHKVKFKTSTCPIAKW